MRAGPPQADILIPFQGTAQQAAELLFSVTENTEIPCQIVICDDGNTKDVIEYLKVYAREEIAQPLTVFRNEQPVGFNESLERCMNYVRNEFIAILDPRYMIIDQHWFGKMLAPLQRDPNALAVFADPDILPNQGTPFRLRKVEQGVLRGLMTFRRKTAPPMPKVNADQFCSTLIEQAARQGAFIWVAPSVRLQARSGAPPIPTAPLEAERQKRLAMKPVLVINR